MANKKITELNAHTTPDNADVMPIVDATGPETKKITWANILAAVVASLTDFFNKTSDTSDDISEGSTNLFMSGAEQTKLAGIEAGADITDASNVSSAGARMVADDVPLAESKSIILDAGLSADGVWCGISEAGIAGATLSFGDLVYLSASDSRWELTDADAEATAGPVKIGICILAAASDGDPTNILLWGKVRADSAFPTLTISGPVYVGTTAGDIQSSAPNGTDDIVRIIGKGNTADELFFCPDQAYIKLQ